MILIMTEKPFVAKDIAGIVGANAVREGYFEGNGYLVTWAIGHLVGLAEPELYDAKYYNRNDLGNLPILPKEFLTVVLKDTQQQFNIIRALINRNDVDTIIDAGDDGSQGYYLQWLIREKSDCRKKVQKLFTSSMTESSIREGLANLRDIREFEGQIRYAANAAKEDWLIGINMSRLYTAIYKRTSMEYFTVGRVQTPTLGFIVKRYYDNKNFVPTDTFSLSVKTDEGIKWSLYDAEKKKVSFDSEQEAEECSRRLKNQYISGITMVKEKKTKHPPKLYNITLLEREAIRKHGMSAAQVLEAAQSLYVKKLITYPRTDSNYITTDMKEVFEARIKDILGENVLYGQFVSEGCSLDHCRENKIIDNAKVTDHHAILISDNYKNGDKEALSMEEKIILTMIVERMLLNAAAPCEYTKYEVTGTVGDYTAKVSYNKTDSPGFTYIEKVLKCGEQETDTLDEEFYETGINVSSDRIYECTVKKGKTSAPALYTEDTILQQMENAGNLIEDEELKGVLKGHGIGTSATRALILKELFDREYIRYKDDGKSKNKKVKEVIPTEKGEYLISVVHPSLKSVELSAELESQLHLVESKEMSVEACLSEFESYIKKIVSDEMEKNHIDVSVFESRKTDIPCFFCRRNLDEDGEKFFCKNPVCGKVRLLKAGNFISNCSKKPLTYEQVQQLMKTGELKQIECQNKYPGKPPYKADFRMNPKFTLQNRENLITIHFERKKS